MAILILWCMIGYICPYYIIKFFTNPVLDSFKEGVIENNNFDSDGFATFQYKEDIRTNVVGILSYLSSSFMAFSYDKN